MLVCPLCRIVLAKGEAICPRDGQVPSAREPHPVPAGLAARFQIVEPFADGESGTLYLADDKQTGRRGLLKIVRGIGGWTVSERSRLKRELVKQATLTHPSLVSPLATGETDGLVWLFREWIDGVSLAVKLARSGALPVPEALSIAAQIAGALDELHRAGLLMRDLSPGHVIVQAQPSGVPKVSVIDAGLAMRVGGASGEVTGKPAYVSPEHANGKLVSFRSDLYALGCVIHEMLSGAPLFRGAPEAVLEAQRSEAPAPLGLELPSGIAAMIAQLLLKEPRDRPFSAQQVRRTLEPYLPQDTRGREQTAEFVLGEHMRPATAASSKGSGTIRPPTKKQTLVGFAVPRPDARPDARPEARPDATQELGTLDLASAEKVSGPPAPPKPKPKPSADATLELSALDLARAESVSVPRPPVRPSADISIGHNFELMGRGASAEEVEP